MCRTAWPAGPQAEIFRSVRVGVEEAKLDVTERAVSLEQCNDTGDGVQPGSHRRAAVNDEDDLEPALPGRPVDR